MSIRSITTLRMICAASFGLALILAAWLVWHVREPGADSDSKSRHAVSAAQSPGTAETIDLADPAVAFTTFQHVLDSGGCEITRPIAIEWLDRHASTFAAPRPPEVAAIFEMITRGGHSSWDPGYRQHIFNSAFNTLHLTTTAESLTRTLHHLAIHDADRIMRLYAMQHLNAQRRVGHLPDGPLADEVHASLRKIAHGSEEECSGYAIQVLISWDGGEESDPSLQQLALATAADTARPVDIRVTALHAAGPASLALARTLATRTEEHVMLRKAAIARIGELGTEADFPSLETLLRENSRIAQATEPALLAIRSRIANPDKPRPLPY